MIRSRTQETVVTITAEVVALAELARHHLLGVLPCQALALATDAVSAVVAQSLGGVVRPASCLPLSLQICNSSLSFSIKIDSHFRLQNYSTAYMQ